MKLNKAIAASVAGTTFMTLFSHIVAEIEEENYSEPLLLSQLMHRLAPSMNKKAAKILGWNAHYAVGAAFAAAYGVWLTTTNKKPNLTNGLVMGAVSGIGGIGAWKTAFKSHPAPPLLPYRKFYTQLFAAHLIFGAVTAVTLNLMEYKQALQKNENAG